MIKFKGKGKATLDYEEKERVAKILVGKEVVATFTATEIIFDDNEFLGRKEKAGIPASSLKTIFRNAIGRTMFDLKYWWREKKDARNTTSTE